MIVHIDQNAALKALVAFDELHGAVVTEQKQDGGIRIAQHGLLGHDRGALEVGACGVARFGVEDVVVKLSVLLKAALVEAAGDDRAVARRDGCQHVVLRAVGVLDANAPGIAVKAFAHNVDVAAQANRCVFAAALFEHAHQIVSDVALGDAAQVELCLGVGKRDGVALHRDGAIVDVGKRCLNSGIVGLNALDEIPKARYGADGDVEQAVGVLGILDGVFDDRGRLGRDLDRGARGVIDIPNVGALDCAREAILKIRAALAYGVEQLFAALGADGHNGVEREQRGRLHLLSGAARGAGACRCLCVLSAAAGKAEGRCGR